VPTPLEAQASAPGAHLIDPTVLARIGNLELLARSVVDGFINGLHRAPHLGASTDFAQHREYLPGDDIRRVDWRLYGRTDRYFIKEYEADTNTNFTLILDVSKSMRYGGNAERGSVSKLEYGCFLGACLAYFSQQQRDRVGMATIDGGVVDFIPPSAKHLQSLLHVLDGVLRKDREGDRPAGEEVAVGGRGSLASPPTQPAAALLPPFQKLAELFRRRSLIAIISDLYEEPDAIVEAVNFIRGKGNDIMIFHLLDPTELEFPFADSTNFIDLETNERMPVIPEYLREQYKEVVQQHIDALGKSLRDHRIDYALFDTSKALDGALFAYLSIRERLMRVR
jgi:uncharacterized protein (DUF58 family)